MKHILLIISLFLVGCTSQHAIVQSLQGVKKVPINKDISDTPFLTKNTKG